MREEEDDECIGCKSFKFCLSKWKKYIAGKEKIVEKHDCMKYLRWIRHSLLKRISLCYYGWWQWRRICKIEGMGRTAVILVTGEDREVSFFALTHLDQLLEKRAFDDAVIISADQVVLKSAPYFSNKLRAVHKLSPKQVDSLLQLACLYQFDDRFICASIEQPTGRNGGRLVGKKGITKEEVFSVGVYGLYPFEPANIPVYDGDDLEILAFMRGM